MRRRPLVPALLATVLLAACGGGTVGSSGEAGSFGESASSSASSSPSASGSSSTSALSWKKCTGDLSAYECSTLVVPVDRSAPSTTLRLALVRKKATGKKIGSLVLNPGGPGGSTLEEFDFLYDGLSSTLKARFDVVGFDPRGVGQSDPVVCENGSALDRYLADDADITTDDGLAEYLQQVEAFSAACEKNSGSLLPHVGTLDTVQDMDALRAALGDATLTYLGYSYGTTLGAQYAEMFPTHVRALVLDGAVDQTLSNLDESKTQAVGFQTAFASFLMACTAQGSQCAWRPGGDLLTAYRAIVAKASTLKASRAMTKGLVVTGVAAALYDKETWPLLQRALAKATAGDGSGLLALADAINQRSSDGTYSSLVPAFTAITCNDDAPPDVAASVAAAKEVAAQAPDFVGVVASSVNCYHWPAPRTAPAFDGHVDGAPPVLVIGSTKDPATPLVEAQALAQQISGSVLLTRDGDGHTGYGASSCIRKAADAYLVDPSVLPAAGTVCPSD